MPLTAVPSGFFDLGEVGPPFDRILLRPHDRLLAGKAAALRLFFLHQLGNQRPSVARLHRIDAVDAEHGRGIEHVALAVPDLVGRAGPGREIAVARSVDEDTALDGETAGLGLDQQRVDLVRRLHDAGGAVSVEQNLDAGGGKQFVGRDLVGGDIVGLGLDPVLNRKMRFPQPVHALQAIENVVEHAMNDELVLAVNVGMKTAEGAEPRRRAGAAEKAVTLDQDGGAAAASRRQRRRDAGGAAAQDDDLIFAEDRRLTGRLGEGSGARHGLPLQRFVLVTGLDMGGSPSTISVVREKCARINWQARSASRANAALTISACSPAMSRLVSAKLMARRR